MTAGPRLAGISLDLDSVQAHLRGYGIETAEDDGANYRVAIPRALALFSAMGARATFFLIASEAARYPDAVREIVEAGHEVACHSMTHPRVLHLDNEPEIQREIRDSKALLEFIAGTQVLGFRMPSWGLSGSLLEALGSAGYRYDASSFPSWMLYLARWSVARRGGVAETQRRRESLSQSLLARAIPHLPPGGRGHLVEIPVSTVPLLRLPYYHTLGFVLPPMVFATIAGLVRLRRGPINYAFHAVDFLDLSKDGLHPDIHRHPGMQWGLDDKLEAARNALATLGRGRDLVTLGTLAQAVRDQA